MNTKIVCSFSDNYSILRSRVALILAVLGLREVGKYLHLSTIRETYIEYRGDHYDASRSFFGAILVSLSSFVVY